LILWASDRNVDLLEVLLDYGADLTHRALSLAMLPTTKEDRHNSMMLLPDAN
jgi:hypothetical protein